MNRYSLIRPFIGLWLLIMVSIVANAETLYNSNAVFEKFENKEVTISGKSEVHLTSYNPLINSSVNLTGDDAWLYLDNVKPSVVISEFLDKIKINGLNAVVNDNVRLQIYRH